MPPCAVLQHPAQQEAQERARQERQRAEAERREQQAAEEREKASRRAWIMQYMDNSSESGSESGSDQVSRARQRPREQPGGGRGPGEMGGLPNKGAAVQFSAFLHCLRWGSGCASSSRGRCVRLQGLEAAAAALAWYWTALLRMHRRSCEAAAALMSMGPQPV